INLRLYRVLDGGELSLLDQSLSAIDNVEHVYLPTVAAGEYVIEVTSDRDWDYSLAWNFGNKPLLPESRDRTLLAAHHPKKAVSKVAVPAQPVLASAIVPISSKQTVVDAVITGAPQTLVGAPA